MLGALVVLSLSLSSAFGAKPTSADGEAAPNFGRQVSDFVHGLQDSDEESNEESDEDEDSEEDTDEDTEEDPAEDTEEDPAEDTEEDPAEDTEEDPDEEPADESAAAANSHGKCVSEVAHSDDVGGPNENPGGAVSFAARITCWLPFADEGADTGDEDPAEVTNEDANTASEKTRGKSAEAKQRKLDRASAKASKAEARSSKSHGHGTGGKH